MSSNGETQATMKAAMYYGQKDIRVSRIPNPPPAEGQVKVKIAWCGICGTDLHEYEAGPIFCPTKEAPHPLTGASIPVCLGHEMSGTITQVATGITNWKVGQRVVVEPTISCRKCYACENHASNACHSLGFVGLSGGPGGFSEYVCVPTEYLHALPDNVSLEAGAMIEPLAVAMHAVVMSGFKKGDTALVLGAGPIGCFVIKTLIAWGASKVFCSELSSLRRERAVAAGAHYVLSPADGDIVATVKKLTGGDDHGVDCSFECAGVQKTLDAALLALKTRGVATNVAIWSFKPIIDMQALVLGERTLKGVITYKDNHQPAIKALASGQINLDEFVTAKITIDDIVEKGFKELIHHNDHHVKILVAPN